MHMVNVADVSAEVTALVAEGNFIEGGDDIAKIDFVGTSRFSGAAGIFPDQIDGRSAQYHAGSFQYSVVPEPGAAALFGLGAMALLFRRRNR